MDLSVARFMEVKGRQFDLRLLAGQDGLTNRITSNELNRPGLAFAGFLDVYTHDRLQVLGNTETGYLERLSDTERRDRLSAALDFPIPCIVITNDNPAPPELLELCDQRQIPLLATTLPTTRFMSMTTFFLERESAPTQTAHGVLVDVFGIGVMIMGSAGVGKSECGLELIERGHRLVADDVVVLKRLGRNFLVGAAAYNFAHHMEVRGLGIVDVELLFGAGSIREEKKIDLVVCLERWTSETQVDRLGIDEHFINLLDVDVREYRIPVEPGRNISILVEVAALQFRIHSQGRNPAQELNDRLIKQMSKERSGDKR